MDDKAEVEPKAALDKYHHFFTFHIDDTCQQQFFVLLHLCHPVSPLEIMDDKAEAESKFIVDKYYRYHYIVSLAVSKERGCMVHWVEVTSLSNGLLGSSLSSSVNAFNKHVYIKITLYFISILYLISV